MTAVVAHNVVLSKIEITVAATLTEFPGVNKADFNTGENVTYEKGSLTSTYDEVQDSGVQSGATISGSAAWDPLDAVQQYIQAQKNNSHVIATVYTPIVGNVVVGSTGVDVPVVMLITKWDLKAERKSGWMVDFEFKITERVELNETDPA